MSTVYVLHHVMRQFEDDEDVKFIGVYSSEENAQAAIKRVGGQEGFCSNQDGFQVNPYELNLDYWSEGFVTVVTNVRD